MNVFFSADWETASVLARRGVASSDSDTERGNEGGRKGEIYAVPADRPRRKERKSGKRTDGRTREDLIQLRPDLCLAAASTSGARMTPTTTLSPPGEKEETEN